MRPLLARGGSGQDGMRRRRVGSPVAVEWPAAGAAGGKCPPQAIFEMKVLAFTVFKSHACMQASKLNMKLLTGQARGPSNLTKAAVVLQLNEVELMWRIGVPVPRMMRGVDVVLHAGRSGSPCAQCRRFFSPAALPPPRSMLVPCCNLRNG